MVILDKELDLNKLREVIDTEVKIVKKWIDHYNKLCRDYSIRYANLIMIQDQLEKKENATD